VAPQAADARTVVVISDLHMGIGRDASGAWQPSEDFRWAPEFSSFLKTVDTEGKSAVDLIVNGDGFDLAGTDIDRVLSAHAAEIAAIRAFARAGSNRVVFVPGDSDAALRMPEIRGRLIKALAAPADRVQVADSGYWLSRDGRVYAEHGHQIGPSAHLFDNRWPSGEQTLRRLYSRLEEKYPIVDNVAVLGAGLKYALAAEAAAGPSDVPPQLLRYLLLTTISWQQFRMELDDGDVEPPMWDLAQVRSQGGAFLVSSFPDDDPFRPLAAKALAGGTLDSELRALTGDEMVMLCDYRAAVRRSRRRYEPVVTQFAPRGPAVAECPRMPDTRGAIFDYFWRSRDLTFGGYIDDVKRRLPAGSQPTVFVHGHTHLPDRSQSGANMISGGLLKIPMEGFSPVRGAVTPIVINGGAWQRTITPVQLERTLPERDLRILKPEDLAPCYSFVHIPPYGDKPDPAVRYWRQDGSGSWALATACGR
jgi:hypothetical protein